MKKPIRLPHSSFINGINIDKSFCDTVINHFKSNIHKAKPGRISNNKLSNIIEKDYKTAHENLSNAISGKIKQQIINNNIDLF